MQRSATYPVSIHLTGLLAYSGISPSTYQSGKLSNAYGSYGETRFTVLAICAFQCRAVRLQLGRFLCRIPCAKAGGGQTLLCSRFTRREEARSRDLLSPKNRRSLRPAKAVLFSQSLSPACQPAERSVPLTNRSIQILSFLARGEAGALFPVLPSPSHPFHPAFECCLSRAAVTKGRHRHNFQIQT